MPNPQKKILIRDLGPSDIYRLPSGEIGIVLSIQPHGVDKIALIGFDVDRTIWLYTFSAATVLTKDIDFL